MTQNRYHGYPSPMRTITKPDETHPLLIAVSGKLGCGKSTVANYLKSIYNAAICPFAFGVKTEVYDFLTGKKILGTRFANALATREQFEIVDAAIDALANTVRPVLPSDEEKVLWIDARKNVLRPILQLYGTEYRRKQDPGYWITKNVQRIERLRSNGCVAIVVDDMRFHNEAQALSEIGFSVVKVVVHNAEQLRRVLARDGSIDVKNLSHASELQSDSMAANYIIDNSGEQYELVAELENIVSLILNNGV